MLRVFYSLLIFFFFILCKMLEIIKMMMSNLDYDLCPVKNSSKTILWLMCVFLFCC